MSFWLRFVESSGDAIIGEDLHGSIRYWNKSAERLFGFRAEEIVGRSIHILVPPESIDTEADLLDRLNQGGPTDHFDTVRLRKDGTTVDVAVTGGETHCRANAGADHRWFHRGG